MNLRARSVGEVVENKYRCENVVDDKKCNNLMDVSFDILDIKVDIKENISNEIKINEKVIIKLNYPKFSIIGKNSKFDSTSEMVFNMIIESVDYIYDGEQFFYANETPKEELVDFIDSLELDQFNKIQEFFENLPSLTNKLDIKCKKCGFDHVIFSEGLESFFV